MRQGKVSCLISLWWWSGEVGLLPTFSHQINIIKSLLDYCILSQIKYPTTMPNLEPQNFGKLVLITGIIISLIGVIIIFLGKIGLFKLPGDIEIGGKNWKVFFPIVSCIIISIVLTAIMWIVSYFRK